MLKYIVMETWSNSLVIKLQTVNKTVFLRLKLLIYIHLSKILDLELTQNCIVYIQEKIRGADMKKVLIISTSLRNNANSEILAYQMERGAKEAGHSVDFISLKDKDIKFCKGCLACQKIGKCVIDDDANAVTEKMKDADVIVWATPVYYYEMAGQMKTMIDRANSLFSASYRFKEVYVIATAADSSKGVAQTVLNGVRGWISCFSGVKLCGCIEGAGLEGANDVNQRKDLLDEAYKMGKNI